MPEFIIKTKKGKIKNVKAKNLEDAENKVKSWEEIRYINIKEAKPTHE